MSTYTITSTDRLRDALRSHSTGVTVVTSSGEASSCGVTVSAFTSVSLDPPLVLVCLNAESSAVRTIARNGVFAVNVLSADQEALARRFSSPDRPRGAHAFDGVGHSSCAGRAPIIDGVACWLDCALTDVHVAGDHVIVIGRVVDFAGDPTREPLVCHDGRYRVVRDGHANRGPFRADSPFPRPLPTSPGRR